MFEIEISEIRIDNKGTLPSADFELLLDFVCTFVMRANGVEVFREVEFPVVELASQLATWCAAGRSKDFDFDSMASEVIGLVYVHRIEGGWNVGSALPGHHAAFITDEQLARGLDAFLALLPTAIDDFAVDIRRLLNQREPV